MFASLEKVISDKQNSPKPKITKEVRNKGLKIVENVQYVSATGHNEIKIDLQYYLGLKACKFHSRSQVGFPFFIFNTVQEICIFFLRHDLAPSSVISQISLQ